MNFGTSKSNQIHFSALWSSGRHLLEVGSGNTNEIEAHIFRIKKVRWLIRTVRHRRFSAICLFAIKHSFHVNSDETQFVSTEREHATPFQPNNYSDSMGENVPLVHVWEEGGGGEAISRPPALQRISWKTK